MSTNTLSEQNSSDTTATDGIDVDVAALAAALGIDLPRDTQRLGVDGAGEVHYHSPRADRVWVVDGDDTAVTHVADVTGKSIHSWISHVRGERGDWTVCYYDRSLGEGLARALQRAQETDR